MKKNSSYLRIRLAEFSNHESAMKAVSTLNSTVLNGRQLHLRLDHSNDPKPEGVGLFVGNIPWETTKQEILDLFSSFNPIDCNVATNMMGKSRGFSIVTFKTSEEANLAIAHMNQMEFKGRILEVIILIKRFSLY
jgi:polyadenylate-binding protein